MSIKTSTRCCELHLDSKKLAGSLHIAGLSARRVEMSFACSLPHFMLAYCFHHIVSLHNDNISIRASITARYDTSMSTDASLNISPI